MRKIFISGITPYADNRGIAAILSGTLEFLNVLHNQEKEIYVWHTFPGSDQRRYLNKPTSNLTCRYKVKVIPDLAKAHGRFFGYLLHVFNLFYLFLVVLLLRILRIFHMDVIPKTPVLNELFTSDIVIELNFGDVLTDELYGSIVWCTTVLRLIILKLSGKKIYMFPQSYGPFKSIIHKALARILLRSVEILAVREPYSSTYIMNLDIDNDKIKFVPDMSFLVPVASKEEALKILYKEGLKKRKEGPIVGITLNTSFFSPYLLNSPEQDVFLRELINTVDCLIEECNATVIFIPHYTLTRSGFDCRALSLLVRTRLKNKDRSIVLKNEYTVEELWAIIGLCNATLSFMTHPVIASLKLGVPVVAVGYAHKTWGIMKLFGIEKYIIHRREFKSSNIIKILEDALVNRVDLSTQLNERMISIYKLLQDFQKSLYKQDVF